jgi:NACalpha-BTF3-like transcription factor
VRVHREYVLFPFTLTHPRSSFLSIAEQNEDENDIYLKDIECIMHQMKVDCNTAVRALKLHTNVIHAILY